jgi:hypothetical protein
MRRAETPAGVQVEERGSFSTFMIFNFDTGDVDCFTL